MDSEKKLESPILCVTDCIEAIKRNSSGGFTSKFNEEGQRFVASYYGAPFFALSQLAPDLFLKPDSSALLITSDMGYASDGGRWLSLYAKAFVHLGKINISVCVPTKPRSLKPPKPLFFQPPTQIVVKEWPKHLESQEVLPDVVIFHPLSLDETLEAAGLFPRLTPAGLVLVSSTTLPDALLARELLRIHGYMVSEPTCFPLTANQTRHHGIGAWWFSAVAPESPLEPPPSGDIEAVIVADSMFNGILKITKQEEHKENFSAIFATRATDAVENENSIRSIRISRRGGICLSTGRFFSSVTDGDTQGFHWGGESLSADLLADAPPEDSAKSPNEDRLALMLWVARATSEEERRRTSSYAVASPELAETQGHTEEAVVDGQDAPGTDSAPDAQAQVIEARDAASEVAGPAPDFSHSKLSRNAGTVNVLATAAMLGRINDSTTSSFQPAQELVLEWLNNKGFNSVDRTGNHHIEHADGELTIETDGTNVWAMRFDDRRTMQDGAIWRVEITLLGKEESAISVRMAQVRSSEQAPPPVASGAPNVLAKIAQQIGMQDAGVPLVDKAQSISARQDSAWFIQLLLNPNRSHPVIVFSGNVDQSANRLAKRLVGVAHVVRIDSALSEAIALTFGRSLSVWGSAVRLYRPGFSAQSDQYQHPVWSLKGTALPRWIADELFEQACAISLEVGDLDERAPSFQAVRSLLAAGRQAASEARLDALRKKADSLASSAEEETGRLRAVIRELENSLDEQKTRNKHLAERTAQLEDELQATRRERNAALEEARQIRFKISNQWNPADVGYVEDDDNIEYPDNWDDLETWVELYGQGRLVLHHKAAKAARESPFKDIPLAYKAMDYLVRYYIPMRTRDANDNEPYERSKKALTELGLEESDVGTADDIKRYKHEYKRLYDGKAVTLDRHLKRGVGFGGEYQFRLYFYYDDRAQKVLVGHMPTHLTNRLTHGG